MYLLCTYLFMFIIVHALKIRQSLMYAASPVGVQIRTHNYVDEVSKYNNSYNYNYCHCRFG